MHLNRTNFPTHHHYIALLEQTCILFSIQYCSFRTVFFSNCDHYLYNCDRTYPSICVEHYVPLAYNMFSQINF